MSRAKATLVAVTVVAAACFIYPLLSLADRQIRVLGAPLVWAYLFVVWALLIMAVAALTRRAD